jgi:NAD(P)-dependent dehydrogenase (short-subunit alcohol dehydrogenase family)
MSGLLQNHIAAVTGAGSGIGRAISLGFAREGASVAALDVDGDTAAQTVASIRAAGGTAEAFNLDITDRAACDDIAAKVSPLMGSVSVLVNNAGINRRTPFTGDPANVIKDWSDIMAVNLDGMFNVTHAFLATLRATKGRIVNIASVQSFAHMRTPLASVICPDAANRELSCSMDPTLDAKLCQSVPRGVSVPNSANFG